MEKEAFFSLIDACHAVRSETGFDDRIYPILQDLIPHRSFICGIAMLQKPSIVKAISVGFPPEYAAQQIGPGGSIRSPLLRQWLSKDIPSPVFLRENEVTILQASQDWVWKERLMNLGVQSLAAHGLRDVSGYAMSYFCFSDVDSDRANLDMMLRMIVPHLHVALMQESMPSASVKNPMLSEREKDVLELVCGGKTNSEIAYILGISAWTVKIHVRNFMSKLNVSTRSQAAAMAVKYRLVG